MGEEMKRVAEQQGEGFLCKLKVWIKETVNHGSQTSRCEQKHDHAIERLSLLCFCFRDV